MTALNKKAILQVRKYRKKGLGIREIARLMEKDPTQILRWLKYDVDTYPQRSAKKVLTVK